jgi:N-acyl-D-amino-acid deacylase
MYSSSNVDQFPLTRRALLRIGGLAAAALAAPACRAREAGEFDFILVGGTVVDGTGAPPFRADVGVHDGRITRIGELGARSVLSRTKRLLDVHGLTVAPGFVDIHTHSDRSIFEWPDAESRVRQGCTSEVTGNCGSSAAPRDPSVPKDEDEAAFDARWTDFTSYAGAWRANGSALNQGMLVGHGTLRRGVLGDVDRAATPAELAEMERRLEAALEQGALGLSSGLEYVPGIYTPPEELHALARIVARHGALYATHMRTEEEELLQAVDEALLTGRESGARLQISHLKAAGRLNWGLQGETLARIERARAAGLDVMVDAYPYTAYSTTLTILLESWSREGGADVILTRLANPELRARIVREVEQRIVRELGGFELAVLSSVGTPELQSFVGRSVADIAGEWTVSHGEAFARLLERGRADVSYVGHGMSEENVAQVLAHPLVMIGSDGRSMAPTGRARDDRPHPRSYGTFPRVLGHYCRERGLFDLATAVRKMTSMPAERVGFTDRGRVSVGLAADLAVFDSATVADTATFDDPQRYPVGITHVLVNGALVVEAGEPTGLRPGRWLGRS